MLKSWKAIPCLLGILALVSCSTVPDSRLARDAAPPAELFITQFDTNQPAAITPTPETPAPQPAPSTPPVQAAPPSPPPLSPQPQANVRPPAASLARPGAIWVPLDTCAEAAGWSKPERIRNVGAWTYQMKGASGLLEVTAGRRTALWNGLNLELGFAPAFTNGLVNLHYLDLSKTLTPLTQRATLLGKANRAVVIDPGHGGDNYGAKSALGDRHEKEFVLDWAMRLERLLKAAGWTVYLTRTADVDVPLADRVTFADTVQADLFISLHFNSIPQSQTRPDQGGIETYCLTPAGMPSSVTRNYEDEQNHVYPNNAFDPENYLYAARIHHALVQATQRRDRGVRRARFMGVLRGQNRPAVLIEGGFLTDATEARLITTAEYRQKLATAIAKALTPDTLDIESQQARAELNSRGPGVPLRSDPAGVSAAGNVTTEEGGKLGQ